MKLDEVEVDDEVEEADDQLLTKLDQTKLSLLNNKINK